MKIRNLDYTKKQIPFNSSGLCSITSKIQENTLLNRGLLDLGGIAVPQMIMSNNKDEKVERGLMQGLYFVTSFLTPFILLPIFNKKFLIKNKIIETIKNDEKRIIEVSKKYLAGSIDDMVKGIRETAKNIEKEALKKGTSTTIVNDFENILNRFEDKKKLKNILLKTHEKVLMSDFSTTALMWCATPWISMGVTKLRTHRSGFSTTYGMIDEQKTKAIAQKLEKEKKKKLFASALLSIAPAIIFPKLLTKGFKNADSILGKLVRKAPEAFNYTKGMFPSKAIFAAIWMLADYPSSIISARDKYERKDRAIRGLGLVTAFFAGDFIMNNILGRLSDKLFDTKIMDRSKLSDKPSFFKKSMMEIKSFSEIENIENISAKKLKLTKNMGVGLYWLTLVANMGIIGFALPKILNKMLKSNIKEDLETNKNTKTI